MLQRLKRVNKGTLILSLGVMLITGCATPRRIPQKNLQFADVSFVAHDSWVGMNVDPQPVDQIRRQLETLGAGPLQSRGEAHVTVISPPEYQRIKTYLSMGKLNQLVQKNEIQKIKWKAICVGRGSLPTDTAQITYFIVIKSQSLLDLRKKIHEEILKAGGSSEIFEPQHYFPHITIGFSKRDLYEQEGVIKNESSCYFDLVDPQGHKF